MTDGQDHPNPGGVHDESFDPVQAIFLRARELPEPERTTWIDAACPTPEARQELLELLAADAAADEHALSAVVDRSIRDLCDEIGTRESGGPDDRITRGLGVWTAPIEGTRIGRFRIGPRLGEGGFAVVHEAEQISPVRRTVAVKILRPGMDSEAVLARFEAERQALAVMHHPGIAAVLDGGVTDAGRPYFVMDRVDGTPITRFADTARLSVDQRLELFARVCDAVQHAHQKGVVHRDLKPGNVLVEAGEGDAAPRPRVIDFGIAKALEGPLIDRPAATRHGQLIGTPGYMSPEQVLGDGRDVDTRADVYALGVMLQELLVGAVPITAPPAAGLAELARLAETADAPRASDQLAAMDAAEAGRIATRRATTPADLGRRLRRDLDWICRTAVARDREQRYAGVSELAADVRRALAGELIAAGPPTLSYRVRTFVRRRRVEVLSAAAIAVAIVAVAIVGTDLAVEAARARDRQAAVAGFLDRFILSASPFESSAGTDGEIAGVGDGSRTGILRTRLDEASGLVGRELAAWPAAQAQVRLTLARALHGLGATDRAADEARAALTLARTHLRPSDPLIFDALALLGRARWQMTQYDEAVALLEPGLDTARRRLGPDDPLTLGIANNLALALRSVGRDAEARALHRDTLERRERVLGPDAPPTVISRSNYARAMQATGDLATALTLQQSVLASHQRTLGPDHPETLVTLDQLGTLLADLGRLREAADMHRRAHTGLVAALGPTHETTLGARFYLAGALGRLGDDAAAESELRAIWEICGDQFGPDDRYTTTSLVSLADVVRRQGRANEAAELLGPALRRAIATTGWSAPQTWALARGTALARQDDARHAEALELLDTVISEAASRLAPGDVRLVELQLHRAVSHAALGRTVEARPVLRDGTDQLLAAGKRSSTALHRGLAALADLQAADGDADAATTTRALVAELRTVN